MNTIDYINLSSGIDCLFDARHGGKETALALSYYKEEVRFIRIQSTMCEQKLWDRVIMDLDYDFLLHLAMGHDVCIFDCSAKKEESRAIYQGLEFIKYVLNRVWFDREYKTDVRGNDCNHYFDEVFRTQIQDTSAHLKLKFFRKFLMTDELKLASYCQPTKLDGKYEELKKILKQFYS